MHEYGPVILILIGILAGIWLNRRDYSELKADMNRQFGEVNRRLDKLDESIIKFTRLEGRVEELSRR